MRYLFLLLLVTGSIGLSGQTPGCQPSYSMVDLDGNNVRTKLLGAGMMWWDYNSAQYEVPKLTPGSGMPSVHSLFAGGLWIGGIDAGGNIKVAAQTYAQTGIDFWPGPITNGTTTPLNCQAWDTHWKVNLSDVTKQKDNYTTYGNNIPVASIPAVVLKWPAKGNPNARGKYNTLLTVADDAAPFVDVNNDGIYNAIHGDYPLLHGDQMVWWIFNDVGNTHGESKGQPLGVEVQAYAYVFNTGTTPLEFTTFYHYEVINKGSNSFDDMYIGQYVDSDLGYAFDDLILYDSARNMVISLNGDSHDDGTFGYGPNPPAIAFKLLRGPMHNGQSQPIAHAAVIELDPQDVMGYAVNDDQFYYFLTGRAKTGLAWTNYGCSVKFCIKDCISSSTVEGDRRYMVSTGPFSLAPGQRNSMDFAMVWAKGNNMWGCNPNLGGIIGAGIVAQTTFDNVVATGTVAVAEADENIRIYPNPAMDKVQIELPPGGAELRLVSMDGKIIRSISANEGAILIERGTLPSGVYFLQIMGRDSISQHKIIFL